MDRILKETVGPIESNLAQLEGSYLFFFVMIAAIGFFISFLLASGPASQNMPSCGCWAKAARRSP